MLFAYFLLNPKFRRASRAKGSLREAPKPNSCKQPPGAAEFHFLISQWRMKSESKAESTVPGLKFAAGIRGEIPVRFAQGVDELHLPPPAMAKHL
jgi:hypothetical protein